MTDIVREESDDAHLTVDSSIYSREALLQACYWFTDRAYLLVTSSPDKTYDVAIRSKPGQACGSRAIAGELANALIDAELRQQVTRETGRIRELIFTKAFAEGGLLDDPVPGNDMDPVELRQQARASNERLRNSGDV